MAKTIEQGIVKTGRKKKPYQASLYVAREKRRRRKSFGTLAEARRWRRDAKDELERGPIRETSKKSVREYAQAFLAGMESGAVRDRKMEQYKPSTCRSYAQAFNRALIPELGHLKLAEVRREDVQRLVGKLMGQGLADSTVRNRLDPLRALYRLAIDEGEVETNPTLGVKVPRQKNRRTAIAEPSLAFLLITALPPEERAVWATAFCAGLRRGELQALRCSDVDLARNEIHVRRSWDQKAGPVETKSAAGIRTIPILDYLRPFLVEAIGTGRLGDELLFGRTATKPFVPSTVGSRAKRAWTKAGLEPVTLHQARHTFASMLIDSGEDNAKVITELLGHSSVQMTYDQYGHLFAGSREEVRRKMNRYLAERKVAAGDS